MQTCAALAFAAPIAQPTQAGAKSVQETTTDDGTIDLLLCGHASGFREVDLEGEVMQPQAFSAIKSEWGAAARPPVYYANGLRRLVASRTVNRDTRSTAT